MTDKIKENSNLINMAINLAILFFLFSVASGISDIKSEIRSLKQSMGTTQPVATETQLRQQIIQTLIHKLNEAQ